MSAGLARLVARAACIERWRGADMHIEPRLVGDVMTRTLETVSADAKLVDAAESMARARLGMLPVQDEGRIRGVVTDRDLTVRAVAKGLDPNRHTVREVMTPHVFGCTEQLLVTDALRLMEANAVRRLLVFGPGGWPVGIVSLDDIAALATRDALAVAGTARESEARGVVG